MAIKNTIKTVKQEPVSFEAIVRIRKWHDYSVYELTVPKRLVDMGLVLPGKVIKVSLK